LSVAAAPWVPRDFTRNGALVRDLARGRGPERGGYPASAVAEILIIEDEVVLAAELGRYLEAVGHGVRLADRGAAGIESARAEPPDLVLLDLRLPDASGLDVLADLVAASPDLPVILMTAYGSVRDAVDAMRRGARDYLQKPLDLEELALVVERVLSSQRRDWELHYQENWPAPTGGGNLGSRAHLRARVSGVRAARALRRRRIRAGRSALRRDPREPLGRRLQRGRVRGKLAPPRNARRQGASRDSRAARAVAQARARARSSRAGSHGSSRRGCSRSTATRSGRRATSTA
jgi:DNA-binding response OmpR family regulator